ncbi:AK1 isoform 2 [Pan troglodytes]|uniref:Adenylate kinase 1 n=3 Tax=Hominidae TaxID=9604 RepID=F8VRY5_HUMAN|nr:AK1 isoform 2 [Pan troglodytes]PNJ45651.1 AK1 isoform 2 [Pongo abelii]
MEGAPAVSVPPPGAQHRPGTPEVPLAVGPASD